MGDYSGTYVQKGGRVFKAERIPSYGEYYDYQLIPVNFNHDTK